LIRDWQRFAVACPLILALVLGDTAESSFRRVLLVFRASVAIIWSNPLIGSIMMLA
jgi:putative tricarboxylic transport membrane protein